MNGKVIIRWLLVQWSVAFALALVYHLAGHSWGYTVAAALGSAMVAERFEPRPWFGRLMEEWRCPTCELRVRATEASWVASIRNTHVCRS